MKGACLPHHDSEQAVKRGAVGCLTDDLAIQYFLDLQRNTPTCEASYPIGEASYLFSSHLLSTMQTNSTATEPVGLASASIHGR